MEEQQRLQEEAYLLRQQEILQEEAAYIASVAAVEAEAEAGGVESVLEGQDGQDGQDTLEGGNKKRRRGNVDYSKLSEELFGGNGTSTGTGNDATGNDAEQ